jgi:ABC-type glutathione transport system ATPase component
MCKLIINKIDLYASCIHFKIKFDDGLTLISGNSGIGKSVLYKALRFKSAEDDRIKCYDAIDLLKTDIIKEMKRMSNKVVVIDNGDVALSMEQRAEDDLWS